MHTAALAGTLHVEGALPSSQPPNGPHSLCPFPRPPTSLWGQPISGRDMQVHPGRGGVSAHSLADDLNSEKCPICPSPLFFGRTPAATDVHPHLASHAIGATAPDATDSASNLGTISHATRSRRTPSCPASGTTTALRLCPWWLGPSAQSLPGPCTDIPDRLPARPVATLPAVLRRSTGSQRGRIQNSQARQVGSHRSCTPL